MNEYANNIERFLTHTALYLSLTKQGSENMSYAEIRDIMQKLNIISLRAEKITDHEPGVRLGQTLQNLLSASRQ